MFLEKHELSLSQLRENIASAPKRRRTKKTTPGTTNGEAPEAETVEYPVWHRTGRMARGLGFFFKVKMVGWKLFCARLNTLPVKLWEQLGLTGVDRLKRAFALACGGFAYPSAAEMAVWINDVRPASDPECTEANILSPELYAANLDAAFRQRVQWWGG